MVTQENVIQTINSLLKRPRLFRNSENFTIWQHDAHTLLLQVDQHTGNDFCQRFDAIIYDPPAIPDGTVELNEDDDEFTIATKRADAAHYKGIIQARGVLTSALKWVTQHGLTFPLIPTKISNCKFDIPEEIQHIPTTILQNIPDVHEVILQYLTESIKCLQSEALLASTIMIGCASEKAIFLLMDTFADYIDDDQNKAAFIQKMNKHRDISKKYEVFEASFKSYTPKPTDAKINGIGFNIAVTNMFQYCRKERNDVGHPQIIPNLSPDIVMMPLRYFPTYLQCIYALMEHFKTNKVTL
jgi:hypothetical protein